MHLLTVSGSLRAVSSNGAVLDAVAALAPSHVRVDALRRPGRPAGVQPRPRWRRRRASARRRPVARRHRRRGRGDDLQSGVRARRPRLPEERARLAGQRSGRARPAGGGGGCDDPGPHRPRLAHRDAADDVGGGRRGGVRPARRSRPASGRPRRFSPIRWRRRMLTDALAALLSLAADRPARLHAPPRPGAS